MKIVSFEWKDAFSNAGWFDRAELKRCVEDDEMWCHTAGFLLKKTRREIIVCTTFQFTSESHQVPDKACNIHKIPRTWVRNFRVIGEVSVVRSPLRRGGR